VQEREADRSPPTSAEGQEYVDLYIHSPIRLHCVVLDYLSTKTLPLLLLLLVVVVVLVVIVVVRPRHSSGG
jgi:hypothetical protein